MTATLKTDTLGQFFLRRMGEWMGSGVKAGLALGAVLGGGGFGSIGSVIPLFGTIVGGVGGAVVGGMVGVAVGGIAGAVIGATIGVFATIVEAYKVRNAFAQELYTLDIAFVDNDQFEKVRDSYQSGAVEPLLTKISPDGVSGVATLLGCEKIKLSNNNVKLEKEGSKLVAMHSTAESVGSIFYSEIKNSMKTLSVMGAVIGGVGGPIVGSTIPIGGSFLVGLSGVFVGGIAGVVAGIALGVISGTIKAIGSSLTSKDIQHRFTIMDNGVVDRDQLKSVYDSLKQIRDLKKGTLRVYGNGRDAVLVLYGVGEKIPLSKENMGLFNVLARCADKERKDDAAIWFHVGVLSKLINKGEIRSLGEDDWDKIHSYKGRLNEAVKGDPTIPLKKAMIDGAKLAFPLRSRPSSDPRCRGSSGFSGDIEFYSRSSSDSSLGSQRNVGSPVSGSIDASGASNVTSIDFDDNTSDNGDGELGGFGDVGFYTGLLDSSDLDNDGKSIA
ncbi:MAG: hypothetical protein K9M13_04090 [Simkaniaceae bacterium]|nr:hypothetical protein [Simkaniaceae bacterium]